MSHWYQYMNTANIVNCHDAMAHSMNGFDTDGDILFTSNNKMLINNWVDTPPIVCVQRKAEKKVINDTLLRISNKAGFGDEIGTTTNHITAMFDVMSNFPADSKEHKELEYRIQCGQLYQQNCIDAVKGIIAKPMPKAWYERINIGKLIASGASEEKISMAKYLNSVCAYRKPYFMNYIYPQQKAKYDKYIKRANKKCIEEFKVSLEELMAKENKTEKERNFVSYYVEYLPSSDGVCVMNRLCHAVENHFDGYVSEIKADSSFDYSIMKSGISYSKANYAQIKNLYIEYNDDLVKYMKLVNENHIDDDEKSLQMQCLAKRYRDECVQKCPDSEELCDIVLDLCYTNNKSKQFAWDVCGEQIIRNLLKINNNRIKYLTENDCGDVEYCGKRFSVEYKELEGKNDTDNE